MPAEAANPAQRIAELELQVKILTHLLQVTKTLNSALLSASLRVEALLDYIMDAAAEITDAESASVLLWRTTTQQLFFAATTTKSEESRALIGKTIPSESIAGTIFREARTVIVDDVHQDPRHYSRVDEDIQFVTRSLMGVPMISKNRTIGVLEVVNRRQGTWTEQDEQHLKVLAEEAAVAIEVAQLVVALQKANNDLSELDKLKNDFIAIAAHELRTPLGVILGYASFLQDEATSPEYGELAAKVMNSALQLRRIIEDMVNLRYLKQKEAELERDAVPLKTLLQDMKYEATTLLDASRHKLVLEPPPDEVRVQVDRLRVVMALNNLMNNATRFTPPGGTITVTWQVQGDEAWIIIQDTGIGIQKGDLEKIFEEFYQVEDHMTRTHGGLGIGLSIARALVHAHGGRIWGESPGLNQGSTFNLTLPLAK
ncbi:MAG: GAF domain-containing sensor histidine kinase [Anaerolineae bacterium]|nr:GAF domain-containing sensor histidine kinase [Anaerolineae bacterium]